MALPYQPVSIGTPTNRRSIPAETRLKISQSLTGRKQSPETVAKRAQANRHPRAYRWHLSPEARQRMSIAQKGRKMPWLDGYKHSTGTRAKMSESHKGHVISAETRKRISEAVKGRVVSEETRRKISKAGMGRRMKPETLQKIMKKCGQHPNQFEIRAMKHLEQIYPGRFSYCGDGTVMINGRCPDAIDTKTRTVVLCNGTYWHLRRHGYAVTSYNKGKAELIEATPYLQVGYRVIFVWEDEI